MAEIILSPLLEAAVESLVSMIEDEVSLVCSVKQELKNLSSTLSTITNVLEDAEKKQVMEKCVRDWLKKLKDVAYEVDNVLDEYATEALRWQSAEHTTDGCNMLVSNFLPCICFKKVFFRRSIGHKIREINDRLSNIKEERKFHLIEGNSEKKIENRETHSFVVEKRVLGRESEKKKIVDLLLSSDNRDDVFVIPIVGLGGLGKTTFAKLVYNDEKINKHFELKMWVCVSEEFEIKRLVKLMIESPTQEDLSLETLQRRLRKTLSGRRFLLVLDDVWNEEQDTWESLKELVTGGKKGSTIIVTTRSKKVSEIMGTTSSFHLKGLSDDECWSLIKERAFKGGIEEVVQPNLEKIGKEIAKKCKGVPLAANTLGGLLRFKREESEWLQIRDNERWLNLLNENEDNILNVLRISYDHLPGHLKQCFTYCSLYPKDYKIEKEKLIRLWMAQGFIQQPSKESGREMMEDIGSDYFNDLVCRSFIQDEDGDFTYKMHDLMHDLAQSIAKDEFRSCIQFHKAEEDIERNKPYHLSLVDDDNQVEQPTIRLGLHKCSYLRTLLMFYSSRSITDEVLGEIFLKLRCLRVLDLRWCGISKLPDSIGNLKHLRYLDLSWNVYLQSLPETICNLRNLQTLDIRACPKISKLPKLIKNMVSLRHLEMNNLRINYMPSGIGRLTCLQALRVYRVGKAKSEFGGLGELQHLINLRGELGIWDLDNAKNIEEAKKANLSGKQHLHTLKLFWTHGRGQVNAQEDEGVLEALQPHTNLRRLIIGSYGGSKFPSWMGNSSFTNLVSIKLYNDSPITCECLPSFGKLQHLKKLRIDKVYGVKYFSTIDGSNDDEENTLGFPSLEKLELYEMPDLEDWSTSGQGNLSVLLKLDIRNCPKLRALPKLQYLMKLKLHDMPNLQDLSAGVKGNLSFLFELDIRNCPKLRALPELLLLKKLELYDTPNLEDWSAIGEGNLSRLCELNIRNCSNLRALPNLKKLTLCSSDDEIPLTWEHLPSLKSLSIRVCNNITSLPDSIKNLSTLKTLVIYECPKLGSLPKGLKHLHALEQLNIISCPLLIERCKEGGEDWPNIERVASIKIDYKTIK